MIIKDTESAQLAHLLLDLKDGGKAGEFDNELMQRYGITFENFHKLICDLAPLCDTDNHKNIRGFATRNEWLVKTNLW